MKKRENYFVTGIGTDVGKTIVSAILVEKLQADYWKPIQAGDLDNSDTLKVQQLVSNPNSTFFEEAYRLTKPMSPHAAAAIDNVTIDLEYFKLPTTNNNLIVEGAGGLMVPINEKQLILDVIKHLKLEVIVVVNFYLGSINHSLLTLELLKLNHIPIKGIVFNGAINQESKAFILSYSNVKSIGEIPVTDNLNSDFIKKIAQNLSFD